MILFDNDRGLCHNNDVNLTAQRVGDLARDLYARLKAIGVTNAELRAVQDELTGAIWEQTLVTRL